MAWYVFRTIEDSDVSESDAIDILKASNIDLQYIRRDTILLVETPEKLPTEVAQDVLQTLLATIQDSTGYQIGALIMPKNAKIKSMNKDELDNLRMQATFLLSHMQQKEAKSLRMN